MINLLPPEVKEARIYGRRNRGLMRWCVICFVAIVGIGVVAGAGYFFINNAEKAASKVKAQNEAATKSKEFAETEKDYTSFTANLRTVIQILSKQILFSDLIKQVGAVTPPGARLTAISLSDKDNALDLNFSINDTSIAPIIQLNLEDPKNGLFDKADIIRVGCDSGAENQGCQASMRALYKETANFLFLNSVSDGKVNP